MGDMFSKKESSQKTETFYNQNAQQGGSGGVQSAISGSNIHGSLTIVNSDEAIVGKALEGMASATNQAATVAMAGLLLGKESVAQSTALAAITSTQALKTLQESQERSLATVEAAVEYAQQTALQATPMPEGNVSAEVSKNFLVAAVLVATVLTFRK